MIESANADGASSVPAIDQFWKWFVANSDALRSVVSTHDRVLDELLGCLQRIDARLFFEIAVEGHPCELIVTAEGLRELFGLCDLVVSRAPEMRGWTISSLKPAHGFDFATEYEGLRIDPRELCFSPLENARRPGELGLRIVGPSLPGAQPSTAVAALWKLLDTALGERVVAEEIAHVEVVDLPSTPERHGYLPLNRLDEFLAWRRTRTPSA
jgi:hypothetical protein